MIRIALVGQPNCGKSTIFNHLVGYKAHTSNLPGTTVEYLASQALIDVVSRIRSDKREGGEGGEDNK